MAKKKAKAAIVESPLAEKSLQQIAYCLGFLALQTDALKSKTKNDLIPILASFGFDRSSIASILQTTPETVSVRLSRLKSKSESARGSKRKVKKQSKGV
jgi:CRP-like cAMP-binding protein